MNNAELDAIIQAEYADAWEKANSTDTHIDSAVSLCERAARLLEEAETALLDAADEIEHLPETDRLISLMRDTETLECALKAEIKKMKGWV